MTGKPVVQRTLVPVEPVKVASHCSESVAERITPIWCQVFGRAWQKVAYRFNCGAILLVN